MSDDDVVIVCGLGHLSEVDLEPELSPLPLDIDLVVFAVNFDRKGPKKEGGKQETDGRTCPLGMQRGGLFFLPP